MKKVISLFVCLMCFSISSVVFAQEKTTSESNKETVQEGQKGIDLKVVDSAVCLGISERMPDGVATEFSKDVQKIYYWTKIEGAKEPTTIKHIWRCGDKVISEVELNIKYPSFRTWSNKTIYAGLEGELSVEVVDVNGNVLKKDIFTIK